MGQDDVTPCSCAATALRLMWALEPTVLECLECGGALHHDDFAPELARDVTRWASQFELVYRLWLASADYEAWARAELDRLDSALNLLGREVSRRVEQTTARRCSYYLQLPVWPAQACPGCGRPPGRITTPRPDPSEHGECEACRLILARGPDG